MMDVNVQNIIKLLFFSAFIIKSSALQNSKQYLFNQGLFSHIYSFHITFSFALINTYHSLFSVSMFHNCIASSARILFFLQQEAENLKLTKARLRQEHSVCQRANYTTTKTRV